MTPEVIAAMLARGWHWRPNGYFTSFDPAKEKPPVSGTILPMDGHWYPSYGTRGVGYDTLTMHATIEGAADEAEATGHK